MFDFKGSLNWQISLYSPRRNAIHIINSGNPATVCILNYLFIIKSK